MSGTENHTHLGEAKIDAARRELVDALAVAGASGDDVYERLAACEERIRKALDLLGRAKAVAGVSDFHLNEQAAEPWRTLGQIRDDLKQARAGATEALGIVATSQPWVTPDDRAPGEAECAQTLEIINRALARIGDGSRNGDAA